jgi:hypothetical protein
MYRNPSGSRPARVGLVRAAGAWLRRGQLGPVDIHQRIHARGDLEDRPWWSPR